MHRAVIVVTLAACGHAGSTPPAPANRPPAGAPIVGPPWRQAIAEGVVGVVGDRLFAWDREFDGGGGGIAERDVAEGRLVRTRAIDGLRINGVPEYWEAVPGGYLAQWDAPTLVRERGDQLAVAWTGAGDDWFDSHAVVDDGLVIGLGRGSAAVVRLALTSGREQWRAPLVAWSQDVTVDVDHDNVYATWQEYDPQAPTPTVTIPRRVRAYELATGRERWTYDLREAPDRLAVHADTIAIAWNDRLELIDGPSGARRVVRPLQPLNAALLIDDAQVIAIDAAAVVAVELATGRERWRVPVDLDGRPALALAGADVLVTTAAGRLMAIDRAAGTVTWTLGLGGDPYRLWATPTAVVAGGGADVAGTALPPSAPRETAQIAGRVVDGGCGPAATAAVRVDGAAVPVASDGRFVASVDARGFVRVEAAADPDAAMSWEGRARAAVVVVPLTGAGRYDVGDLTAGACGR
ncbi:MAG: PQQ-binding-like beta-propeller repeat protein [Myxococcales bacterium]|nr:PQQ-binding-like beta-propeller repeat protein [Myxococcales bacterium]